VTTVLGLLGIALYISIIVSLAAGVTFAVVKISPDPNKKKKTA
jgi:hypothetical protein